MAMSLRTPTKRVARKITSPILLGTQDGTPASSFKRRTVCVSSSEISVVDSQGDEYEVKSQEDAVPAHASRSGPRPTPTPAPRPSLKGVGKAHKAKLPARHLGVLASFEDLSGVANEVAKEDATGNAPATESEAGKGAPGDISPREDVAPAQKIIPTYPASMPEPSPPPVTPQDPTPRQRDSELDEVYRPLDIASMNLTRSYPLVASPPSSNSTPSAVAQPDTAAAAANPPDQARIGATPPVLL